MEEFKMRTPNLKSFERKMKEQGYTEITHGDITCSPFLIGFNKTPEESGCPDYKITEERLASPLKIAGLDSEMMWGNIDSLFITFEKPRGRHGDHSREMHYRIWKRYRD